MNSPTWHTSSASGYRSAGPASVGTTPLAESFFATLKRELIEERSWPNRSAVRTAIFEWIESWYSIRRLHSSLGYHSPAEYETILAA
ncbi:hypothetical protein DIZ27_00430 [Streptomyces sp. NWU339]|uniref:IS3 family transposase n=1 Tax=Streptomyces sp. NWU339 TaxID=2185284 RepID=UPI000D67722E|nr:IS3 family transposase [Streptomyces sp. NWU339]PWI12128.1 hypothetical protein DIZ27_00430 [Streptomyces sp. NWU339]